MCKFVKVKHFVCRHSKNESKVKVLNVYSRNELLEDYRRVERGAFFDGKPICMKICFGFGDVFNFFF